MPSESKPAAKDEVYVGDLFRPLLRYSRLIWQGTLVAVIAAIIVGGAAYVLQPTREMAVVAFRPVFTGVDRGEYPNETAFSTTDIVEQAIVDKVVAVNNIQQYCSASAFRGGLTVEQRSAARQFLDLEFQARLSDVRLTTVDRQRIQDEFQARRQALPRAYYLTLIRPPECVTLPTPVAIKALQDVLETWATESQESRNVLKLQVSVLSPAIFDEKPGDARALLVRADVLRSGITRVIGNITEVERIPGAVLVRVGDRRIGLAEVRVELEDLLQSRIDPLLMVVGQSLGRSSQVWVRQALQAASIRLHAAQQRAEAYRTALREYSGIQTVGGVSPPGSSTDRQTGSSDVQALTPQIDQTFIDRIVEMSEANTTFRQEVTRSGIEAAVEAVQRAEVVDHYKQLLAGMEGSVRGEASDAQMAKELAEINVLAKDATRRFNEIYDEVSRVALRAGPMMYRIQDPPSATSVRVFGLRSYALLVLAVLVVSPILLAGIFMVHHFIRRMVAQVQAPPA